MTPLTEIETYFRANPPFNTKDILFVTYSIFTLKKNKGNREFMPVYEKLLEFYLKQKK